MHLKLDLLRTITAGQGLKSFRSSFKWINSENLGGVSVGPSCYGDSKGHGSGRMSPECSVGTLYCLLIF